MQILFTQWEKEVRDAIEEVEEPDENVTLASQIFVQTYLLFILIEAW